MTQNRTLEWPPGAVAATENHPPGGEHASPDQASHLFNSAISAFAVASAAEIGLLDEIAERGWIHASEFAAEHDLHRQSVRALLDALACGGVVEADGDLAKPAAGFASVYETKGFFTWLLGGCGELLRSAADVTHNRNRQGSFITRDPRRIGIGCADFGARFIDPLFDHVLDTVPYSVVADLGCGSGERLIRALRRRPDARGVGIDISPGAVELARDRVTEQGLADRVTIIEADVHHLAPSPALVDVDFVTSFLMGHDFWPRESCLRIMRNLCEAFPAVEAFALCDTYRSQAVPSRDLPMLTLGFEYVHALMGQYIPTLAEWRDVFRETGWRAHREHDLVLPPCSKIFHLVPER